MKNWFPYKSVLSPLLSVGVNLLLVYVVYTLARLEFLFENFEYYSQSVHEGRLLGLLWGGIRFDTPGIFYTNSLYILLMLFPLHWKENKRWYAFCKWVYIIINSAALIANVVDSVYFSYSLKRTSWSIFSEFGNESNFISIAGVELIRHWYLVLFVALLIWGMWHLYVSPQMDIRRQPLIRYYIISILSLAAAAVTTISGIRGGFLNHWYNYVVGFILLYITYRLLKRKPKTSGIKVAGGLMLAAGALLLATAPVGGLRHRDIRPIAISNANAYVARSIETPLVLNTPFTMIRSIGNEPFHNPHYFDDKTLLETIYSPLHNSGKTDSGSARLPKQKNICIIIIESFGKEYIGSLSSEILGRDTKGYTPFTDSLASKSMRWRYSYDNGSKSIDGMPSILASIPSMIRPFIVTPQASNSLAGLPALLAEKGYDTAFFHGARTGSMGFDAFANSIGFKTYYGREDYVKDERFGGNKDFDGYWAIWDEPFMQWFAVKMTDMNQPFMTAIFTASNHHPFKIPEKYEGKFPEGTMKIHKTAGYTDHALKEFFATASRQPWYDNTIFVITNDHTNMREFDEFRSDIGSFYGPILIFDPSGELESGEREGIAQQIDIMPTLLDYLGYDRPYIAFGQNLLDTPPSETWAFNYINGTYQYIKYGYILQFDGVRTRGIYKIDDHLMSDNLIGKVDVQSRMEQELKALIQSYTDRMLSDRLTANNKN